MPRLGRSAAVKGEAAPPSSLGLVAGCGAGRCVRVARGRMVPHELVALDSRSTPLSACLVSRRQRVGREVSSTAEDTLPPADTLSFRVASLSHRGRAGGPRARAVRSEADPAWMPASRDSQRCGDARFSSITAHRSPTPAAVVMRTRSGANPLQHPLPSGAVRFQHPSHASSLHVIVRGVFPRSAGPVRFRGCESFYGGRFTEWAGEPVDPRRNGHGWPAVATHSWDARRQIPATELPDAQGIGRSAQFCSDVRKRHRGAVACKQVLLATRSHRNRVRDCNGEFVVFGLHDDCPIPEQPPRQG